MDLLNKVFLFVPCHRIPNRCYHIKGKPLPICSRCLSILIGYLFIPIIFLTAIPFWVGVLFQLPMLIDGFTQLKKWRMSNNFLRTVTGLLSGIGMSIIIVDTVRILFEFIISL